jgi:hypothetical protein
MKNRLSTLAIVLICGSTMLPICRAEQTADYAFLEMNGSCQSSWDFASDTGTSSNIIPVSSLSVSDSGISGSPSDKSASAEEVVFQEQTLSIDSGAWNDGAIWTTTPEGCHAAWITQDGYSYHLVYDERTSPPCENIAPKMQWGPNGKCVIYQACVNNDWLWLVDSPYQTEHQYTEGTQPMLSRDGTHIAHVEKRQGKYVAVIDGVESLPYDDIDSRSFAFSEDNKSVGFVAAKEGRFCASIDGNDGDLYDAIAPQTLTFSPDSRHVVFYAQKDGVWKVVLDGKEGPRCDGILPGSPVFSADGAHMSYVGWGQNQQFLAMDQIVTPIQDDVSKVFKNTLRFGEDGIRVSFVGRKGSRIFLYIGKTATVPYDIPSGHVLVENSIATDRYGDRYAFRMATSGQHYVVIDGKPGTSYACVGNPIFSSDGKSVAYAASRDANRPASAFMVTDKYEGARFDNIFDRQFVANRLVYTALRDKGYFVVLDDKEFGPFEEIVRFPVFNNDGSHFAFIVRFGKTGFKIVFDDRPSETYDGILCGPVFRSDGVLEFMARRGMEAFRVTGAIE